MKMIVAHGANNEIGKDNRLLWRLKEDMAFFVETTKQHGNLLCGRKTLESIPGKNLPGRKISVLSKSLVTFHDDQTAIGDISEITAGDNYMIIGGEQVYRQTINMCTELFVTKVDRAFPDADSFFPDYTGHFELAEIVKTGKENGLEFSIEKWVRVK